MKRFTFLMLALLYTTYMMADVIFRLSEESAVDNSVRVVMERNMTALLTEIHVAGHNNEELDLRSVQMDELAKEHLKALWEMLPFECKETAYVSECLYDHQGYQIRGIKILMKPKDDSYTQSVNRELTVSMNKAGVITGVRPALELQENVRKIIGEGNKVKDLQQRMEILKFVEDFRCYYNEKNIHSLKQIFSEDALIITGHMMMQQKTGEYSKQLRTSVKYSVQTKSEYLSRLEMVFQRNEFIDVEFNHISVVRHGAKPNIYGVTLHQTWQSSHYCDEGWLFLLWDFSVPEQPQIHVRTWQPYPLSESGDVFTLNDFYIP